MSDGSADATPALRTVWRRTLALAGPVMVEQTTRTLMRTTDVVVTALFSPAAVVAIGLADLYARFPLRIGLGLGGGAIALASQDTGAARGREGEASRRAAATRDEAVTQALLLGAALGVPFVLAGILLGDDMLRLLGASDAVVDLGGTYLAVVFATAPARHVALIGARSLQGTGDTRTPMVINVVANVLNASGSVVLGLGLLGAPRLDILGVGLATAAANLLAAGLFLAAIAGSATAAGFARPRDATVARQLLAISAPRVAEGLAATLAEFPLNALLLAFGTPVNAGFQIGRRLYQQVTSPLGRGYHVAANVLVGQALGRGDADDARFAGRAVAGLAALTVGALGLGVAAVAGPLIGLFENDPATLLHATRFAQGYGVVGAAVGGYVALAGALQGAGETRIPFVARVSGAVLVQLGVTWLVGSVLGYGALGGYLGVPLGFVWLLAVVAVGFRRSDWAGRATRLLSERTAAVDG